MTREELIRNLEYTMEKHKNDTVPTFSTNISVMCKDILDYLEEQEPKIGYCRDCKWWKDKDGVYRRGLDAESKCPINRKVVFEGNGYCYMYEPQESEDKK